MWHWYDKGEEWLAIMLLGGTSLTMFVSAVARAVGSPFAGGAELAQFLFIWTAVLGADITLRQGGQVRIDALVIRLPIKLQLIITSLCVAMMMLFLTLLIWYGYALATSNWQRPMGVAGLSYGYITLALPVGAGLMLVSLLRRLFTNGLIGSLVADNDEQVEEAL